MKQSAASPQRKILAALSVWLVAMVIAGCNREEPGAYHGYVEGEYVRVATSFAGSLEQLDVQRGVQVTRGDALFALENENEAAARREAEERLRNAEAQLANLEKARRPTEIESARAQLEQAQAALKLSRAQLRRTEELVARNFVSKAQLDEARSAYERDQARAEQLRADLATAKLAAREDEIKAARAAVAAARATLEQADWRLRQKSVTAPVAGLVADTLFVKGEWVPAGAPVVTLLPPPNIKVRFFVPEPVVGSIHEGQGVVLNCDGCPRDIPARVTFISPQAEYTPPVIYSKES
ncbi:MAG TPA: HlyD family efflux transporter periplasmic adaptor subunit, partial [Burkholderiales bacterium]|nr:HlyD family efflux transporter periplasmic adaptor subunit [Burkholderiales bacterium]